VSPLERVLQVVRTQVQFDLAECAAQVAQATAQTVQARDRVTMSARRCDSCAAELRSALHRSQVNPASLGAMHRMYHGETLALHEGQTQLSTAASREQHARSAFGELRNRERSIERALQVHRQRRQARLQTAELLVADDLWSQRSWRERP